MARKIEKVVNLTDDLDGGKADRTYAFEWSGISYEIDLSKRNGAAFEKAVRPYLDAARRVRTARRRHTRASHSANQADVRAWARANGFDVADRGRLPSIVLDAYRASR